KGTVYCISCGTVHEENSVVSSLNFTEISNGSSVLTGQIIKITENYTKVGTSFISTNNTYVQNTIRSICVSLGLSDDHVSSSFRWYKLSLQHNLTKGRSLLYTLSAVIYITCRQEKTPHLLIDFSVLLRIDVFKIGRTFLKITNLLNIKVPLIDPSLYLPRFVNKLKMSEKVLCLANRIVSRMKRDWIVVGRRPNNLCGASLVVAGRILDEVRGISEVARIVHVSVVTIKKRLKEMAATASANLSINEFCNLWLEKEEDPPVNKEEKIDLTINTPEELSEEKEYKLKKFEDFAEKIKPIENKENINLRKEKNSMESYNGYLEENKENINLRKEKNSMEKDKEFLDENKENINLRKEKNSME
ncbi:transcription initiation factor IIIB, partial [Hamiltosporidium magnivora]